MSITSFHIQRSHQSLTCMPRSNPAGLLNYKVRTQICLHHEKKISRRITKIKRWESRRITIWFYVADGHWSSPRKIQGGHRRAASGVRAGGQSQGVVRRYPGHAAGRGMPASKEGTSMLAGEKGATRSQGAQRGRGCWLVRRGRGCWLARRGRSRARTRSTVGGIYLRGYNKAHRCGIYCTL